MLWMTLALAGDYDDWADAVLDEIEDHQEQVTWSREDAARAQDELALRCIAQHAGTVENALLRAEQAAERLEAAERDGNAYAIDSEVLVLQAELDRSRVAYWSVQGCWGGSPQPGPQLPSFGAMPLELALGGGWSADPLLSGEGSASRYGGSLALPTREFYRWTAAGGVGARVAAERWPKEPSLNHWAEVDLDARVAFFPDRRVRFSFAEELGRDPVATASWVTGPAQLFEHEGRLGLEGGHYRYAFLGLTHRYDRAVLPDEERRVQAWGGELEWRWPRGSVVPKGIGRAELLDNNGVGGWGADGVLGLELVPTWWLVLDGGGGLALLGYEDLFQPMVGWQAYGELRATGSYRNLWVRWDRELTDDWLGRGWEQRGWSGGLNSWVGSRFYVSAEGHRLQARSVLDEGDSTTRLGADGALGVRVVNSVRVEGRGHFDQRGGLYEGQDYGGGLYLVMGGL